MSSCPARPERRSAPRRSRPTVVLVNWWWRVAVDEERSDGLSCEMRVNWWWRVAVEERSDGLEVSFAMRHVDRVAPQRAL